MNFNSSTKHNNVYWTLYLSCTYNVHPRITLIRQDQYLGKYICLRRNCDAHLATVIYNPGFFVLLQLWVASFTPLLTSEHCKLFFCVTTDLAVQGLYMPVFMFAFTQLMTCSTIFNLTLVFWFEASAYDLLNFPAAQLPLIIRCFSLYKYIFSFFT